MLKLNLRKSLSACDSNLDFPHFSYTDVMKQNRKDDHTSTPIPELHYDNSLGAEDSSNAMIGGSTLTTQWSGSSLHHENNSKGPKSVVRHGPPSDCTSMSADSPGSRQSVMTGPRSTVSTKSINLVHLETIWLPPKHLSIRNIISLCELIRIVKY